MNGPGVLSSRGTRVWSGVRGQSAQRNRWQRGTWRSGRLPLPGPLRGVDIDLNLLPTMASMDRLVLHDGVVMQNKPALAPLSPEGALPVRFVISFALQAVALAVPQGVGFPVPARHKSDQGYLVSRRGLRWRWWRMGRSTWGEGAC